ncbi:MAG: branched-chain amino acid ABC transporter substrate-binding protein, partial [Dermatophilaceae bacterium]
MPQRSVVAVGASLLVASLALSACGTRDEGSGEGSGEGDKKVAKIGVIVPLSGDLAALGKGMSNSVDLAIKQANESNAVPGWTLELAAEDDEAKPEVGKNAATKLAADTDVVGVIGTLNSSVAQSVQPVLASANITQVSPANTNPTLTRGAEFEDAPKRPYPTYFRTSATDSVQGPFAARYLFQKAGIKSVATIHDKKTYGQGIVETFTAEFTKLGGKVVAAETINPDDDKYDAVITKVKPAKPQAVYYGGEYPQAGPLSQQMKAAGLNVPLMGGDGIQSGEYPKLAGATAAGDLATSIGAPTAELESAKKFVSDYEAAGYDEPYEAYGAYSYDAANALISALKTSLKDADSAESARQATVEAMTSVTFDGVTGKVGFDEFGDTTTRILTVYEVKGTEWAAV